MTTTIHAPPSCPGCGNPLAIRWQTFSDRRRHLRASCRACNRIQFWPQSDTRAVEQADAAEAEQHEKQPTLF